MGVALVRIVKRMPSVAVGGVLTAVTALAWGSLYQAAPMIPDRPSLLEPSRPPLPPSGDGTEPAQAVPECSSEYPNLKVCSQLPDRYVFDDEREALAVLKNQLGSSSLRIQAPRRTTGGPCPGTGGHYNVRDGKSQRDYPASIVCCPCCDDDQWGAPQEDRRCGIVAKNPGCQTRRRSVAGRPEDDEDLAAHDCDGTE
jgi:hypothetical protein